MIPFIDLASQQARIRERIDHNLATVLDHGAYIMGPEVLAIEARLAESAGTKHCISCSSGTDALILALLAQGLRPGQGVIVPSFTFAASAEVMPVLGAVPVFAEIDPQTFNLDPASLGAAMTAASAAGVEIVGIIGVGLFGQPADYTAIGAFAAANGLWVIDDAAQSFGATADGIPSCGLANISTTSFFPSKPLGCYGDGGALFTADDTVAETIRLLSRHGQAGRYEHVTPGRNSRLDSIQAAVLLSKLTVFDGELEARLQVASRYDQALSACPDIIVPTVPQNYRSAYSQYTIRVEHRDGVRQLLTESGVPTAVHYPLPITSQKAFLDGSIRVPVASKLASSVLSLPMHPYLSESDQSHVIDVLLSSVRTLKKES